MVSRSHDEGELGLLHTHDHNNDDSNHIIPFTQSRDVSRSHTTLRCPIKGKVNLVFRKLII